MTTKTVCTEHQPSQKTWSSIVDTPIQCSCVARVANHKRVLLNFLYPHARRPTPICACGVCTCGRTPRFRVQLTCKQSRQVTPSEVRQNGLAIDRLRAEKNADIREKRYAKLYPVVRLNRAKIFHHQREWTSATALKLMKNDKIVY